MTLKLKANTPILAVDDDAGLLRSVKVSLASAGMPEPALVSDSRHVMDTIRNNKFHLVLLDLVMPEPNGMELLKQIKESFPAIECIIITAIDDVSSAVQAMKLGAYDYLVKPIDAERLVIAVTRALERYNLKNKLALFERRQSFDNLQNPSAFGDIIAEDPSMAMVFHQVEVVAPTDYNLVITGESGTGKEMIARVIHKLSNRSQGPFVAVNMASFNKGLFEDGFFGHTKGAYTGALADKKGFFDAARGGTLFLDEIAELDPSLQGKMLRAIQEREFYRLGSTETRDIDVRIISATNSDIREDIEKERFREDLFYRLNMFHITLPPLRERRGDIIPLALHFLRLHCQNNKKDIHSIDPEFAQSLLEYPFNGNVRELESIIAKSVLMEQGEVLTAYGVDDDIPALRNPHAKGQMLTLEVVERAHILRILKQTGNNRTQAARILGIGLRTLQRKLQDWNHDQGVPK